MKGLQEYLKGILEEVQGNDLPKEIYVSSDQHPDIWALAQVQGSRKFLIMAVYSVPFYADPELAKGAVKVVTATAGEKIINLKK
jgi:hypothetical protein